mmetsp:Transcript_49125/g.114904  ORF Transcript_49125/g.114904 Transcript_49125/m.114904 type:complete len:754 (+) Transcript_49125:63-2324(+)
MSDWDLDQPNALQGPAEPAIDPKFPRSFEERIAAILSQTARAVEIEHKRFLGKQRLDWQSHLTASLGSLDGDLNRSFDVGLISEAAADRASIHDSYGQDSQVCGRSTSSLNGSIAGPGSPGPDGHSKPIDPYALSTVLSGVQMQATTSLMPIKHQRTSGLHFRLLPEWSEMHEEETDMDKAQMAQLQYYAGLNKLLRGYESYDGQSQRGAILHKSALMMEPTNKFRIFWDVLAAVFLTYDLCMIPMTVFDIPQSGFVFGMAVSIMFYWTLDIMLNFFVGYYRDDGDVELRFHLVASKYCKTWLLPDLGIVSLDWVSYGVQLFQPSGGANQMDAAGLVRVGKITRFVRVARVVRLLRFGKLRVVLQRIHDSIGLESTAIIFSICKNLLVIILINHCLASIWFFIGEQNSEGWLMDRKKDLWLDNYLMSMHWSIANFTPGSSSIQPRTTAEYVFHIFVLFFAMVVFSVFVSSTTSMITKLMALQSSKSQQLWVLKGFLLQHKFPAELRDRVLRYVKTALGNRRDLIHRSDVELLGVLSQPLREEVQLSLHLATLRAHPLIKLLSFANTTMMRRLSSEALEESSFSSGDTIFTVGESIDKMSFVVAGVLRYNLYKHRFRTEGGSEIASESMSLPNEDDLTLVNPSDFFCEATLWTRWHCRGTMTADADCDLLDISGPAFRRCVKQHHGMTNVLRQYAAAFVEVLARLAAGETSNDLKLSDLQKSYITEAPGIVKVLTEPALYERKNSSGLMSLVMA